MTEPVDPGPPPLGYGDREGQAWVLAKFAWLQAQVEALTPEPPVEPTTVQGPVFTHLPFGADYPNEKQLDVLDKRMGTYATGGCWYSGKGDLAPNPWFDSLQQRHPAGADLLVMPRQRNDALTLAWAMSIGEAQRPRTIAAPYQEPEDNLTTDTQIAWYLDWCERLALDLHPLGMHVDHELQQWWLHPNGPYGGDFAKEARFISPHTKAVGFSQIVQHGLSNPGPEYADITAAFMAGYGQGKPWYIASMGYGLRLNADTGERAQRGTMMRNACEAAIDNGCVGIGIYDMVHTDGLTYELDDWSRPVIVEMRERLAAIQPWRT